jgi:hypothetical protein
MAVKLADLQLIYGVAGARTKFEDLVAKLIKAEHPKAARIRTKRGDDGIDVYVGEFSDPAGIDVYQCKFFPLSLGKEQQNQIRKSFNRCRKSTKYKTRTWTLCLPIDPSFDEATWFENWRKKQAGCGIKIEDIWGAEELETLLYQSKNVALREAYFKEEHLRQIREMHVMLRQVLDDLASRSEADRRDREAARRAEAQARWLASIAARVEQMRGQYQEQLEVAVQTDKLCRRCPSNWEVVIHAVSPSRSNIVSLNECWSVAQQCRVWHEGWEFPIMRNLSSQRGEDWIGATRVREINIESWRLSQDGVFISLFPIWDDVQSPNYNPVSWSWVIPPGFTLASFLDIGNLILRTTLAFRLAGRLAATASTFAHDTVQITIRLTGTGNRVVTKASEPRDIREFSYATLPELGHTWCCSTEALQRQADRESCAGIFWILERFGWERLTVDEVAQLQSERMSPRSG